MRKNSKRLCIPGQVSPMLNAEQKKRLSELIARIQ